jgi:hypothetical protein
LLISEAIESYTNYFGGGQQVMLLDTENINVIDEDDFNKIGAALIESVLIRRIYKQESVISFKEDLLDRLASLLKKILTNDANISKETKLNIINLLDKVKGQLEILEMMKTKTSGEDILEISKRLSRKSQSAFGS